MKLTKYSRYSLLNIAWVFFFYEYVLRVSDSTLVDPLMRAFQIDASGIGILSSAYYFSYVLMQIPAGILLDRYSIKTVLFNAICIVAAASFLFSQAHTLWAASFARFLMGLGSAFAVVATFKIIRQVIQTAKPSFYYGLTMMVGTFGAVCGQAPWAWLAAYSHSWRFNYRLFALVGVALAMILWFYRLPKKADQQSSKTNWSLIQSLFRRSEFYLLVGFVALVNAPLTVFAALWGVPFFQSHHLSNIVAGEMMSAIWLGNVVGGPLLGWIADRRQQHYLTLFICGITVSALFLIVLLFPINNNGFYFLNLFLIGVLCSCNVVVFTLILQMGDIKEAGLLSGLTNTFNMGGGPILQLTIGFMLSFLGVSLSHALFIIPMGLFLSSLCLLSRCRQATILSPLTLKE